MGRSPSLADRISKRLKYNRIFQFAPVSRRKIGRERERSVAYADEAVHARADRLEKPPDLAIASLPQRHAVPAIGTRRRFLLNNRVESRRPVLQLHAAAELSDVRIALHPSRIFALELVARVHEAGPQHAGIPED